MECFTYASSLEVRNSNMVVNKFKKVLVACAISEERTYKEAYKQLGGALNARFQLFINIFLIPRLAFQV